jgi:choline dehydrogenase-like flavoprotein
MLTAPAQDTDANAILQRHYDVIIIIIGSGAGGSSLAYQLSQTGQQVLLVGRGDYLKPQTERVTDRIGIYINVFQRQHDTPIACAGGQTKFYRSALYRLRESDSQEVEHESGRSPAWPITYADLEPYYHQAETLYRVHGAPDGDPSEPPRGFPSICIHRSRMDQSFRIWRSGSATSVPGSRRSRRRPVWWRLTWAAALPMAAGAIRQKTATMI